MKLHSSASKKTQGALCLLPFLCRIRLVSNAVQCYKWQLEWISQVATECFWRVPDVIWYIVKVLRYYHVDGPSGQKDTKDKARHSQLQGHARKLWVYQALLHEGSITWRCVFNPLPKEKSRWVIYCRVISLVTWISSSRAVCLGSRAAQPENRSQRTRERINQRTT